MRPRRLRGAGRGALVPGLFWWKAFSDGHGAGAGAKTFNVVGRPIEVEIREGFRKIAGGEARR